MYDYFISSKDKNKLLILKHILFSDSTAKNINLMSEINIPKSTFNRYLNELQEDISYLFKDTVNLIGKDNEEHCIYLSDGVTKEYVFELLRIYYSSQSSNYKIFRALLEEKFTTIEEIAQLLNMSTPLVYKHMSQISKILNAFSVKINLKDTYNIVGDEIGLRFFYYFVQNSLTRTIETDMLFTDYFDTNSNKININRNLQIKKNLVPSQINSLKLLEGISKYRLIYAKKTITISDDFLEDIKFFYDDNYLIIKKTNNYDDKDIVNESYFFCFALRSLIFDIDTYKKRENIVSNYINSKSSVGNHTLNLMNSFSKKFKFFYTPQSFVESFYILIITIIYLKHINIDFTDYYINKLSFDSSFSKKNPLFTKLEKDLQKWLNEYISKLGLTINKNLKKQLSHILIFILDMNEHTVPLSLSIHYSSNFFSGRTIEKGIRNIYSEKAVIFVADPTKADIIISDTYEEGTSNSNFFYYNGIYDQRNWENLVLFIAKKLSKTRYNYDVSKT